MKGAPVSLGSALGASFLAAEGGAPAEVWMEGSWWKRFSFGTLCRTSKTSDFITKPWGPWPLMSFSWASESLFSLITRSATGLNWRPLENKGKDKGNREGTCKGTRLGKDERL